MLKSCHIFYLHIFLLVTSEDSTLFLLIICVMHFNTRDDLILQQVRRMKIAHKLERCLITMELRETKKEMNDQQWMTRNK